MCVEDLCEEMRWDGVMCVFVLRESINVWLICEIRLLVSVLCGYMCPVFKF